MSKKFKELLLIAQIFLLNTVILEKVTKCLYGKNPIYV